MFALAFMFLGILIGFLLRNTAFPVLVARCVMPVILALLFCMGVLIGANDTIMNNLPSLGLSGLVLAASTLAGSVACVSLICHVLNRRKNAAATPAQPDRS